MKRVWKIILSAAAALALIVTVAAPLSGCGGTRHAAKEEAASAPAAEIRPAPESPAPSAPPAEIPSIRISEVMSSNKATLAVGGRFPDWIELYNAGGGSAELSSLVLRCGGGEARLPARSLAAGEYAVVAVGDGAPDAGLAELALSKEGCRIELLAADGTAIDSLDVPACESDRSFARDGAGRFALCDWPSPGFANGKAGYDSRQETLEAPGPLQINEVMVYNEWDKLGQGACFDWVEIKNAGTESVDLSRFYLSDSLKEPRAFRLPDAVLEPGGLILVFCAGADAAANERRAAFALNAQRDRLYLSADDGALLDCVPLRRIPLGCSFGRLDGRGGFFFFDAPTPGGENGAGERRVADAPLALTPDGVYDGVESVTLELSADGEIRYTTDGSVPTADSPLYEGALTIASTSVVRAVNLEEGCLPSEPLNLSFLINERHTLPVVSVMGDPAELMGRRGVYNDVDHERETAGAAEFFDGDGGFSIECGIKLHGMTSKRASGKRSLKLCFRPRYDGELHYDLFGNGVSDFSSILLRSDIETNLPTLMRDNLMHQAAIDCFPALPSLDHRYAVLYINGQYWGLYSIREAHSAAHYANHYGYDAGSVAVWKGLWERGSESAKVCDFALYNDLRDEDNYRYAAEHLDIDSIIGWCVIEGWCCNIDSSPANIRYYYSSEDDRMRYGLSDLDLGMFAYPAFEVPFNGVSEDGTPHTYAYNLVPRMLMYNRQFQLEMARQLSAALHGKMSDEAILAQIDRWHDELVGEMGRNMLRWFSFPDAETGVALWERNVEDLRRYVTQYGGRAKIVAESFRRFATELSDEEYAQFFGDLA